MPQYRKPIPVLLAALLTPLAFYVSILAFADILDSQAETSISAWFEASVDPTLEEWNGAVNSLKLAQQLDPMNSETPEKLGKLYQFSYSAMTPMFEDHVKTNQQAMLLFKQAAEKRPAWAPHWANIVQAKHDIWNYDEEFERAIINAAKSGPWFEYIQPIVLHAGERGWPVLSEDARQAVIKVMNSAILMRPRQTIIFAINSGLIKYAMPVIDQNPELKKVYRYMQASYKRKAQQQLKKLSQ